MGAALSTEAEVRVALAAAVAYLDSGITIPAETLDGWRALAGTTPNLPLPFGEANGFAAGMAGSAAAATRWTVEEVAAVDRAILRAAANLGRFTADDVWAELERVGRPVPVTKGLGARLLKAVRAGDIERTDDTITSTRAGVHGHGQRLAVWRRVLPHVEAAAG